MTGYKKAMLSAVAVVALAAPAVASGVGEQANTEQFPPGYLQINPTTCKFLHTEIDQATLPTWKNLRQFAIWEDARHDAKLTCLTNRPDHTSGITGYIQVRATGTGHTVTATCPTGDVVLGGGSPDETTGSSPGSDNAWTVKRDHLSPPLVTVIATCAKAAPSP